MDRLLPWRHVKADDTTEDARRELHKLEARDPEVSRLHRELREAQVRNHFSGMVNEAIRRRSKEGR